MILATVSADRDFHPEVLTALSGKLRFDATWSLTYEEVLRLTGVSKDRCLVVLDFSDTPRALTIANTIAGRSQITAIAVNCPPNTDNLLRLMQAGIRDALPTLNPRELLLAAHRVSASPGAVGEILADVYAFVPAKPGCGATTLATYATGMVAELANQPALLLDFDLRLGVTTFLLKADGRRSLSDALQNVNRLDTDIWGQTVSQIGNLHLLGSGPTDGSESFALEQFIMLLDFVVRQYSIIGVDTAGTMEEHEGAVLQRASKIFLVCTPDVGALHLARRKVKWFQDLRVLEKVEIVMNRSEWRDPLSVHDIEKVLQIPVRYLLPADSKEVTKAVHRGTIIEKSSALGKAMVSIAKAMLPTQHVANRPAAARRFVEYFYISPERSIKARN